MNTRIFSLLGIIWLLIGCRNPPAGTAVTPSSKLPAKIQVALADAIQQTRQTYAPDKRVALFAVEAKGTKKQVVVKGETNLLAAKRALLYTIKEKGIAVIDSVNVLPTADLGDKVRGVVTISVASIRAEPREAAELTTQATLGTPVKIYKKQGFWCLVQTPDGYISWADKGAVTWMNEAEFTSWQNASKLIYLNPTGYAYIRPGTDTGIVSDLVGGAIIRLRGESGNFYQVEYPDGRQGFVLKTEAQPYEKWVNALRIDEQSLVQTAKQMMGLPYLWGGTSYKAVDCSGFTKTIYFMNGMIIPRDASQQVHTGELIDISKGFGLLRPGDLLFFGKPATASTPERVTHVGMWIGNNEFIHASSHVRVSSVDKNATNYDEFNLNRLLRVKRLLHQTSQNIVQLSTTKIF